MLGDLQIIEERTAGFGGSALLVLFCILYAEPARRETSLFPPLCSKSKQDSLNIFVHSVKAEPKFMEISLQELAPSEDSCTNVQVQRLPLSTLECLW